MAAIDADPEAAMTNEFRGLWVVRYSMGSRQSIERVIERAREGNLNALLVQVNGRGEAYYESRLAPRAPGVQSGFDPLAFCVQRAHAARLQVHAWINAFTVGELGRSQYQEEHVLTCHPEWSLVDQHEVSTLDYSSEMGRDELVSVMLDPAVEGVKQYVRKVFMEVVADYGVDGVHFDYIRYPGRNYGYGREARGAFEKITGCDALDLVKRPEAVCSGRAMDGIDAMNGKDGLGDLAGKWDEFRREQVTEVVRGVYRDVKRTKPHVAVSCAVFPNADDAYIQRMQDWRAWIREGIVDFVAPMAYTADTHEFAGQIKKAVDAPPGGRALAGVGVYRMPENPANCVEKIQCARELGSPGVVLFSYDSIKDRTDYWEALARGPFNQRAAVPRMVR